MGSTGELRRQVPLDPETRRIRKDNRQRRLQEILGDSTLSIDDLVVPIGEKEVEAEITELEAQRDLLLKNRNKSKTDEINEKISRNKTKLEEIMKEMYRMKEEQTGGIGEVCENLAGKCLVQFSSNYIGN